MLFSLDCRVDGESVMRGVELTAAPTLSRGRRAVPAGSSRTLVVAARSLAARARCAFSEVSRAAVCSGSCGRSCGTAPVGPASERGARRSALWHRRKQTAALRGARLTPQLSPLSTTLSSSPPHAPVTRLWRAACCALPEAGARAFLPCPRPPARLRPTRRAGPVHLHQAGHDVCGAGRVLGGDRRAWVVELERLGAGRSGHRDGLLLLLRRGLRRRGRADKTVRSREFSDSGR